MIRWFLPLLAALALSIGCGDDGSVGTCKDLCKEAQAGSCTSITGDCNAFCEALDRTKGPSGCTSQSDAYEGCLKSKSNVCDANCGSTETALSTCVGIYCLQHASDADCVTLKNSF